jgi:hypothetical protein
MVGDLLYEISAQHVSLERIPKLNIKGIFQRNISPPSSIPKDGSSIFLHNVGNHLQD